MDLKIWGFVLLLFACQTDASLELPPESLPEACSQTVKDLPQRTFLTWEDTQAFSLAEENAIKGLSSVSEIVRTDERIYQLPGSRLVQEQLLNDNFHTIFPLQGIDGWNLFVIAQQFAPDSNFIRTFVLLMEGPDGWQSHFLYPSGIGRGNYLGAYDISVQSLDLDYDGRNELIFTSHRGNLGQQLNVEILKVSHNTSRLELKNLEVPKMHTYQTKFQQNYLVHVQLLELKNPLLVRRVDIAKQIQLNYDDSGRWIGSTEAPFLYEAPSRLEALSWGCGEDSYNLVYTEQPLKGLADDDTIGTFAGFWILRPQEPSLPPQGADLAEPYIELGWSLLRNNFTPEPGNEVLEYQSLLPR